MHFSFTFEKLERVRAIVRITVFRRIFWEYTHSALKQNMRERTGIISPVNVILMKFNGEYFGGNWFDVG